MANRPRRPYRRAYLNDFQKDAIGNYVYTGKLYAFCGDKKQKRTYVLRTLILWGIALASTVVPELFEPVEMSRSAFLLLPWLMQLIFIALTGWSLLRMTVHDDELREYVYKATVEKLPRRSMASAITSLLTLLFAVGILLVKQIVPDSFDTWVRLIGPLVSAVSSTLLFFSVKGGKWEEKH